MTERVEIKAHPKLIFDVIERQAGTLSKALLEAVMNSIEACENASDAVVDISLDEAGRVIRIQDNGRGIRDRNEVDQFFLTFGTPHSDNETVIWKQFRMGRGQIFSYGRNTWRTSTFRMFVDIAQDKAANEFPHCVLDDDLPFVDGCVIEIELYNAIGGADWLKDELRKQIEFMPGVIRFNGEQLNTPPAKLKWTEQDADAYYMFGKGHDLAIYNMGAYVMSMSASRAGVTGVIVSKSMLKVNFARNAVQEDSCPVWARIRAVIKENRVKKTRQAARRLNGNERIATLIDLRDGEQQLEDVKTIGLFEDSNGRVLTFNDIRKNTLPWTFAEHGDRLADKLIQSGEALCINEEVVDALSYRGKPANFFYWLVSKCAYQYMADHWQKVALLYREFDSLTVGKSRTSSIIPHDKLTRVERRIIKILEGISYWGGRRVVIGLSGCNSLAWTDGRSYIALNRDYLRKLCLTNYSGPADLIHTMFHEAAHDCDTSGTHYHGEEFYRRFHEITYRHDGAWGCPLAVIGEFHDKIRKAAHHEVTEAAIKREQKAKAARDKALGVAKAMAEAARTIPAVEQVESVPTDNNEADVAPVVVTVVKNRGDSKRFRRKRPLGLD